MSNYRLYRAWRQVGTHVIYRFGSIEGKIFFNSKERAANYIKGRYTMNQSSAAWNYYRNKDNLALDTLSYGHNTGSFTLIGSPDEDHILARNENDRQNTYTLYRNTFEFHYRMIQDMRVVSATTLRDMRPFPTAQMLALLGHAPGIIYYFQEKGHRKIIFEHVGVEA